MKRTMRTGLKKEGRFAFTVLELILVFIIGVLAALVLPAITGHHQKSSKISCINNLKQVGLAFRMWAADNGDRFPAEVSTNEGGAKEFIAAGETFRHFQVMSNELNTPKVVNCPYDSMKIKPYATNFGNGFNNSNVSYFVNLNASSNFPAMFLAGDRHFEGVDVTKSMVFPLVTNQTIKWNKAHHGQDGLGNIAFADGSVQKLSSKDLVTRLKESGAATNLLAIP